MNTQLLPSTPVGRRYSVCVTQGAQLA